VGRLWNSRKGHDCPKTGRVQEQEVFFASGRPIREKTGGTSTTGDINDVKYWIPWNIEGGKPIDPFV